MNCLQKIDQLLEGKNLTIVYGTPRENIADTFIALGMGDGDIATRSLGDNRRADYITVNINVYASDYNVGLDTLLDVRNEIENAVKSTVNIIFVRYIESGYNEQLQKHILKSQYKIIE